LIAATPGNWLWPELRISKLLRLDRTKATFSALNQHLKKEATMTFNRSRVLKNVLLATLAAGALSLGACASDDGYGRNRGYTSMSVGVSSYDRPDHYHGRPHARGRGDQDRDGVPNRYDRDRDGDGVPNRVDDAPRNPNWR